MRIAGLEHKPDRLAVTWDDGAVSEYHYVWLRDNCACPECRHPDAWERTLDPLTVPPDLAGRAENGEGALHVTWPDGHVTAMTTGWLRDHAYEPAARAARRRPAQPWTGAEITTDPPVFAWSDVAADPGARIRWLRVVRDRGFAVLTGVPTEPGTVLEVARLISYVRETNFGLIFDVRSKPDPENLAYTPVELHPHTDLPNREALMGLQLLHCLRHDAVGGESVLVDGFAAAAALAAEHPEDHELLATVAVPYRFVDDDNDIEWRAPVIGTGGAGETTEVRYHSALLAPLDVDPDLVGPWYRAYRRLGAILRRPELHHRFRMRAGECQVFDNRRVLHARAAFDPQSGERHFQGCYVDYDDFLSRLRVLERGGADFRQR